MAKIRNNPNKKLLRAAGRFMPFDYGYMLNVEKAMLESMLRFFESDNTVSMGSERCGRWISKALVLLDMLTDNKDYYYFTGSPMTKDFTIHLRSRVNTNNTRRFFSHASGVTKHDVDVSDSLKLSLYERKLWHLYNAIREAYMQTWWD